MGFAAEFLLTAAPNYEGMFKTLLALDPRAKGQIESYIGWAKGFLKKQDRIVWFLRWVRAYLSTFIQNETFLKYAPESDAMTKFLKALGPDVTRLQGYDGEQHPE